MQSFKNCAQHNFPIQFICFDQKCIEKGEQIMCKQCTTNHNKNFNNHRVIEYPIFKKYIHTFRKQIEYEQLKEIIKDQFIVLKKDIMKQITDFEDSIMTSISLQFNEEHEFQVFQGEVTLLTKNELFNKFVINTSSLNMIKDQMKIKNMNLLKQIRNLNDELKKIFESEKKDIKFPKIDKAFLFSTKNKHENIEVFNNGTSIRRIGKDLLGHSQLALCKQPFSPISNKVQFLIKQISSRGCIAIGACFLTPVQKNKFFKCWQLGQGAYSLFVNTYGHVKSNHHSNKLHSDVPVKNMKLRKGDVISVEIDFMREKIVFVRNKTDEFSMPVDIGIEKLYPFAAVSYMGDFVEIL